MLLVDFLIINSSENYLFYKWKLLIEVCNTLQTIYPWHYIRLLKGEIVFLCHALKYIFVDLNQYRLPCTRLYLLHYRHNSILKHAKTTKKAKLGRYIRMASIFRLIELNPLISYLIWDNLFYELRHMKIAQSNSKQYIEMCNWLINLMYRNTKNNYDIHLFWEYDFIYYVLI